MKRILLLAAMVFSLNAGAAVATGGKQLTADQWVEVLRSFIPNRICQSESPFRTCFKVSEKECESEAIRAVRICIETHSSELKKAFTNPKPSKLKETADSWGAKLGGCTGAAVAMNWAGKLKNELRCVAQFIPNAQRKS